MQRWRTAARRTARFARRECSRIQPGDSLWRSVGREGREAEDGQQGLHENQALWETTPRAPPSHFPPVRLSHAGRTSGVTTSRSSLPHDNSLRSTAGCSDAFACRTHAMAGRYDAGAASDRQLPRLVKRPLVSNASPKSSPCRCTADPSSGQRSTNVAAEMRASSRGSILLRPPP
jgi:hypothetical protein